ncbi:MAG TPA: response regulator [Pyrinomonadaceae bacterium]|nr:response regulator [Pyrinomonadaceae bacterium]
MGSKEGTCPTIMVVDDNEDLREMLRFMVERLGYQVVEAENGREAIEIVRRRCPDLILMDLSMPVMDGLAATRRLREVEEMCDVPIIAISANRREQSQAAALAAGCNEYLTKPVNFHQLNTLLGNMLSAKH